MKVLYITTMYPIPNYPQQGIFCHEQVKALKELDVEVDVVVPIPFYGRDVDVKEWEYEGVKIKYIRFFKLPGARDFHKTGQALYKQLERKLDLGSYDVYHADAPLPAGYAVMKAAKKYNKPFVVHGHGLDVFLGESYENVNNCNKIVSACEQVYREADAIVGVSKKVLEKIEKRVDVTGRGFVAYNGVDVNKFTPVERTTSDRNVKIISIGNLIPLKGHEYTLRAIRQLVHMGYDRIEFALLGRGELEQELKDLAKELDIDTHVTFMGYVPYEKVAEVLKKSDVFVLPSYYEALGCVYLEAMACGIPTIGCKGNGIDEVIEDGKNGYLVDSKNKEQIVERLQDLMSEEQRTKMGQQARMLMVEDYKWSDSAKSVLEVYRHVQKARGKN